MSEDKFKIGDKVICVDDSQIGVETFRPFVGSTYIIQEGPNMFGAYTLAGIQGWWNGNRFELAQEEQKAMQNPQGVPITDDMILIALGKLDEYARAHDHHIYGLPPYTEQTMDMVDIIKESLGLLSERDKQIKQLQDIAGIDREQAVKLLEAGIVFGKGKEDN